MIPQDTRLREAAGTSEYDSLPVGVTPKPRVWAILNPDYDLAAEDLRELRRGDVRDFAQLNLRTQKPRKRSDAFVGYATRDDHFEIAEIGVHVQREPMAGDPTRDPHADCPDLLVADPNSRQAGDSRSGDAELRDRSNQHFFDVAHVAVNIAAVRFEVDDRVADKLAGPVIGHVAAAARFVNFD